LAKYLLIIFYLFLIIILIPSEAFAQKPTRPVKADTTRDMPFAKPDTLETKPVYSKLYWYNLESRLFMRRDSSRLQIYRFADEKKLIYTDVSDVLWNKPLWFVYDLKERGRPIYISMLNKYPHQTAFYYNNMVMNDPAHGMFDSQLISLQYIHSFETDMMLGNLKNSGSTSGDALHVISNSMHTKAPWSKILYKQGGFGHSDLDISFVLPITETFSVQLGGFNQLYDGTIINANYHGYNFRGEVLWQYSSALYLRGQFYLSRKRVGMTPYNFPQELTRPQHVENRDDFFFDLTWLPNDSSQQRLHVLFYNGYTLRGIKNMDNRQYVIDTYGRHYAIDANYNMLFGSMEVLIGLGSQYPKIWGDAFKDGHRPYKLNVYGKINMAIWRNISLGTSLQVAYSEGFEPSILPTVAVNIKPASGQEFDIALTRGVRFPNINERFFDFDTLYGNQDLEPEEHIMLHGKYKLKLNASWHLENEVGYGRIEKEIQWREPSFENTVARDFSFVSIGTTYRFWKLDFSAGGHYTFSQVYLTPRSSLWAAAHFNHKLLKGVLNFDAYGTFYYYDTHEKINFEPRLQRFYRGSGENDPYYVLNWKLMATIGNARIFAEMDNAFDNDFEVINGYTEFFYRFRFGVNWVLWD
jgi:hypothetical protein